MNKLYNILEHKYYEKKKENAHKRGSEILGWWEFALLNNIC